MTAYNGHRSWAAWNVSLWIANDEGLHRLALDCLAEAGKRGGRLYRAAKAFQSAVGGEGARTPDGARYSLTSIREALAGLES